MTSYLYSPDIVRVVLVVGVIVSVLFYERVQLTTGGAIVPAYLSLGLIEPLVVVLTLVCGLLTYVIVNLVIARRRILYGRRKFEVEILVGLALVAIVYVVHQFVGHLTDGAIMVGTIGFLVPGIMAHDMFRQGPHKTLLAVGGTTAILGLFIYVYTSILPLLGGKVQPPPVLASALGYDRRLILVAVAASVLIGMAAFGRIRIRSGGFITAAYVAFVVPRWWDLAYLGVVAVLTWLVVVKLLMPRLLIFGRRKLSTMVLVAALVGWTVELAARYLTDGMYVPGRGLTVMTLMVPALVANDAQRQGWERTAWGLTLTTAGVYGVTNLVSVGLVLAGAMSAPALG